MAKRVTIDIHEIALFIQDDAMMQEMLKSVPENQRHRTELLANFFGVSRFTINYIDFILKNGIPELIDLINLNKCQQISANRLYHFSKLSHEVQKSIISKGGINAIQDIPEKDLREMNSFTVMNSKIDNNVKKSMNEFRQVLGENVKKVCIFANQIEMWCNTCSWGFDIFLPSKVECCPYCHSTDIRKREPYWNPNKSKE